MASGKMMNIQAKNVANAYILKMNFPILPIKAKIIVLSFAV